MADNISVLFGSKTAGKIGELQLDATLQETHNFKNAVTQFPVEDGSSINDNIRIQPDEVTVSGFVTNTPVSLFQRGISETANSIRGAFTNLKRSLVNNSVELAVDALLRISGRKVRGERSSPQLVTIILGLRVYSNMALTNLVMPRDARTGETLRFTATFIEVKTTDSESVDLPNASTEDNDKDRAASTVKKGAQKQKQSKTAEQEKASVLYNLIF